MVDIARRTSQPASVAAPATGHCAQPSDTAAKLTVKGDHFRPYIGEPDDSSRAG
jgi:hypothetical protein